MKKSLQFAALIPVLFLAICTAAMGAPAASIAPKLPGMPKFRFENFTTANGLPNDHVYAVLVDGDRIWAGTDDGLAL